MLLASLEGGLILLRPGRSGELQGRRTWNQAGLGAYQASRTPHPGLPRMPQRPYALERVAEPAACQACGEVRPLMSLADIRSDFALLDDWEDRYRYVIELGRGLPPLPESLRTDANKVRGCASQVWLVTSSEQASGRRAAAAFRGRQRRPHRARPDRHPVRHVPGPHTPRRSWPPTRRALFAELGLKEHITPQRSNGFFSMVERIRNDARAIATAA